MLCNEAPQNLVTGEGFIHMPGDEHCLAKGHHSAPPLAMRASGSSNRARQTLTDLLGSRLWHSLVLRLSLQASQKAYPDSKGREAQRQLWMGRAKWMCGLCKSPTCQHLPRVTYRVHVKIHSD